MFRCCCCCYYYCYSFVQAFYDGLKAAIVPGVSHVLDLGAGTCLLSMFAAKLGARRVTAVERHPQLAELCKQLLQENDVDHVVHVINLKSTEMSLGRDGYDEVADILVSETFDSWIIEEGFFPSLADLRSRRLIGDDTVIVPSAASLHLQLAETMFSFPAAPFSIMGLDYESVRRHRPVVSFVENSLEIVTRNLSAPVNVFHFDFQKQKLLSEYFNYAALSIPITESGVLHAGCFWFTMYLDADRSIVLSNKPGTKRSSWNQIIKLFHFGDVHVEKGSVFPLLIAQMPQRYAFAAPSRGERIVRISSTCRRPVKIHATGKTYRGASGAVPLDFGSEQYYLFSFYGGVEYNVWITFHGQMFGAFADYSAGGACTEAAVDGFGNAVEPDNCHHVLLSTHFIDTSSEQIDGTIPLYEMTVTC